MRMMKKIAMLMLAVCLAVPCFSFLSHAADGKIMFTDHTDPAVETGTTVEVTGVVNKSNSTMGKIEITMTYDTSLLKFKSGDGITESSAGTIQYSGDATYETGSRKEFKMTFEALSAGTATIQISNATVKNVSGTVMNYTKGTSTIKITGDTVASTVNPGDLSDGTVEVNGAIYNFSDVIPQNEIPDGYVESTLEYDLVTYKAVYNENFNLYLVYLVGEDNVGDFFMYVEETATFAPYEAIEISDKTTIVLLSEVSDVLLPAEYKQITVPSANGHEFPAWQTDDASGFCILYALNNSGEKELYQYDNEEGTYQRFVAPEIVSEKGDDSFIGKLSKTLENHLDTVILVTGFGFLLFVVIIVVLSVKLYNRNAELDEIYDEYGIEDNESTEDDIMFKITDDDSNYGDENYDDEYEEDAYEEDSEVQKLGMESFVQEGMREVFPEPETEAPATMETELKVESEPEQESLESVGRIADSIAEADMAGRKTQIEENTLGEILAQQMSEQSNSEEEFFDNDDDEEDVMMEDFSVDFIDLDD